MSNNHGKKTKKFMRNLFFGYAILSVCLLYFGFGFAVAAWRIFPYDIIWNAWTAAHSLSISDTPRYNISCLGPAVYEEEGVVAHDENQVCKGMTLITGAWESGDEWDLGARLIDLNGKILHEWIIDPRKIWTSSPHSDRARGSKDAKHKTFVHGSHLYPNGDLAFNLEYYGLAKINANSEVIWRLPYRTHHSLFHDENQRIWVCGQKWREEQDDRYIGLQPPFVEDTILRVSPEGVIEREISVLESLYASGYEGLLFVRRRQASGDVLHLNNVEVLSESKAEHFPQFNAGDIMMSLRNINTVLIIDGESELVKWSISHPFIAQHDPDFTDAGKIVVFDNHMESDPNSDRHLGSRILSINPQDNSVETLYGHREDQYFFTRICGKQQILPNDNLLITEAQAGRVFEVARDGKVVWSWIAKQWDNNKVPEIQEGTRYSPKYVEFTK